MVLGIVYCCIMLSDNNYLLIFYKKYIRIEFNANVCLTLVGAGYFFLQHERNKKFRFILVILSLLLIIIAGITLAEYIFHFNAGIDEFFMPGKYGSGANGPFPGRMKTPTSIVYLSYGLSMLGFTTKNRLAHIFSQYLLYLTAVITSMLLIGFIYNASFLKLLVFYALNYFLIGILIVTHSLAATFLHPTIGVNSLFSGNLVGNKMARRLFMLIVSITVILGVLKVNGLTMHFWDFDSSFSLFIIFFLLVVLLIIWNTANWLNEIDKRRILAEAQSNLLNEYLLDNVAERTSELSELLEKYKESELKFRTLAEKSMVGIYIVQKGQFIYVNPRFAEVFGYETGELINNVSVEAIIHESYRTTALDYVKARMEGLYESIHYEAKCIKKNGKEKWVEFYGSRASIGGEPTIIGSMIDINERKIAEDSLKASERKYKLLFERSPKPMMMVAKDDLCIISVNEAAAKLYGFEQDELLNKSASILRPVEDLNLQADIFKQDFSDSSKIGPIKHLKKDGTVKLVELIISDIIFESKKVRLTLITDVTDKLKAEAELQKSEANLSTILETTNTAYFLLDNGLNVITFNQQASLFANNFLNRIPEEGNNFIELLKEERALEFSGYVSAVLQGGNINYDVSYPHADGQFFFFNVRMYPIRNNDDVIIGLMVAVYDVTDIKKYTSAIEEQNKRFREIAWLQSHIVRAPLARIMGIVNLLTENNLDTEEHTQFLKHLLSSADELDTIIKDITHKTQEINAPRLA